MDLKVTMLSQSLVFVKGTSHGTRDGKRCWGWVAGGGGWTCKGSEVAPLANDVFLLNELE